jgi:hypothetical protein
MNDSASRSVDVPNELIDHVLAYLKPVNGWVNAYPDSGPSPLSNCALVCQAWRPLAQIYIFKCILLRSSANAINALMHIDTGIDIFKFHPCLLHFVHEVKMSGWGAMASPEARDVFTRRCFELLEMFPSDQLKVLDIRGWFSWAEISDETLHIVLRCLRVCMGSVESISLSSVHFSSPSDLERLLRSAPHLHSVHLFRNNCHCQSPRRMSSQNWELFDSLPLHTPALHLMSYNQKDLPVNDIKDILLGETKFRLLLRTMTLDCIEIDNQETASGYYEDDFTLARRCRETLREIVLVLRATTGQIRAYRGLYFSADVDPGLCFFSCPCIYNVRNTRPDLLPPKPFHNRLPHASRHNSKHAMEDHGALSRSSYWSKQRFRT